MNLNLSGLTRRDPKIGQRDPETARLLEKFWSVFQKDPRDGLPPKREVDHEIQISPESKPSFRPIFHLSPAELIETKEYITELLNKGKIRPSRSPCGALLFFVKQKEKLRGVIDHRALNIITKPNSSPIPRTNAGKLSPNPIECSID